MKKNFFYNLLNKYKKLDELFFKFYYIYYVIRFKRRNKYKRSLYKRYRDKPVEPYAFIRVKNEIKTVQACLESILPHISKGVIGYHRLMDGEIDDGTEKYIIEFCKKNTGFKLFKYDYVVYPPHHDKYRELKELPKESRLDSYYNAVLSQIPKDEWLIKIDCDHIFDKEKLKKIFYLPQNDEDIIKISRMNLHYENKQLYVLRNNPICDPGDCWLIKNKDIYFGYDSGMNEKGTFFFYEQLKFKGEEKRIKYKTQLFNWHFPMVKNSRRYNYIDEKDLIKFSEFSFSYYQKAFFGIESDMLDEERILRLCEKIKN